MSYSVKAKACVGLAALVIACGLFALPSANAESGNPVRFAFAYNAEDLDSVEGRNALNARLFTEATKQCRVENGARTPLSESRRCRDELVRAAREALDNRLASRLGGCVAIALSDRGATKRACTRTEYAVNAEMAPRT